MKRLFDMDNPLMQALGILADLMVLNLLTIVCSLPVLTAGAALTALNATANRILRGEEHSVTGDYFRSFRENFSKGVGMGMLFTLVMLVLLADFWAATQWMPVLRPVFAALALLTLMLGQYAFALLARYENTLLETLKNACLLAVGYFPRTLAMAVFAAALWLLSVQFLRYGAPILFLFGLSLPCYVTLLLLQSVFSQLDHSHSQS